jgi:hypothetical protein
MEDDKLEASIGSRTFYAVLEQPSSPETKVFVDDNLQLRWDADDRVTVFNEDTYYAQYKFLGETGDRFGKFEEVPPPAGSFVTGNPLKVVCAVYPYENSPRINNAGSVVTTTLPATQSYLEGSFGRGANTMISMGKKGEEEEDIRLSFKNVCGYIALKVYGKNIAVSSITFEGNDGETIAGKADINVGLDVAPSVSKYYNGTGSITLECEDPVTVGSTAETATIFWLVVPPTKFEKGFTVTVTDKDGRKLEKSTSRSLEVKRSCLTRMAPFEVKY